MWLLTRFALAVGLLLVCSVLLAGLCWLLFGTGLHRLRVWRRWRRRTAYRRAASQWSPWPTMARATRHVKVIGIDQVSARERRIKFSIR